MDPNQEQVQDVLARMTDKTLGADPAAPPAGLPPAGAPQAPPPPPPAAPPPAPPTAEEKAQEAAAPKTEANKMVEEAMIAIKHGDGTRNLSASQVQGTLDRYAALNHKHAGLKPVIDLAESVLGQNPDAKPEQLAGFMREAMEKALQHNPTMGGDGKPSGRPGQDGPPPQAENAASPNSDAFAAWEDDNDSALPPGYRDIHGGMASIQAQLAQNAQLMQAVLATAKGIGTEADDAAANTGKQQAEVVHQAVVYNLDKAAGELGLSEEAAEDFMAFAADRGYDVMTDFADFQLAKTAMADFKNNIDSPELERMRELHRRRQSYTGSLGSAPTAPEAGPPEGSGDETFDRLLAKHGPK